MNTGVVGVDDAPAYIQRCRGRGALTPTRAFYHRKRVWRSGDNGVGGQRILLFLLAGLRALLVSRRKEFPFTLLLRLRLRLQLQRIRTRARISSIFLVTAVLPAIGLPFRLVFRSPSLRIALFAHTRIRRHAAHTAGVAADLARAVVGAVVIGTGG